MKTLAHALAALAFAGSAHAGEGFDAFKSLCAATHADQKAALAAADAAGWARLDPAQVPIPANPTFKLDRYEARTQPVAGGFKLLIVGTGTATMRQGGASVPAVTCIVVARPAEVEGGEQFRALIGMAPVYTQASNKMALYAYAEGDKGPAPIGGAQGAQSLFALGKLRMAICAENNGTTSYTVVNLNP